MGSMPDSADCYTERREFDASSFDQRFFQATSMGPGGMQTLATSSHPSGGFMPINMDPAHTNGNYDFASPEFQDLQSALLSTSAEWHSPTANFATTAQWPMHDTGLRLQTNCAPTLLGTKAQQELVSPADTLRHSSHSSDVTVDPSQTSNDGSTSARKRFKPKPVGSDTARKHKRTKSNASEMIMRGSDSEMEMDLADLPEEDDHKREKFLARNRVAASKCRQKKKEWTNQLEDKARELSTQQTYLTATVNMLRNELLELKCRCLEHHDCKCDQIRDYLKSTVAGLKPAMDVYNDGLSFNDHGRGSSTSMASGSLSEHSLGSPIDRIDKFGSFSASPALAKASTHQALSTSTVNSPDQSFPYAENSQPSPRVIQDHH